jgi:hypothetical protein
MLKLKRKRRKGEVMLGVKTKTIAIDTMKDGKVTTTYKTYKTEPKIPKESEGKYTEPKIKTYYSVALYSEKELLEHGMNKKNFIEVVKLSDLKKEIKNFEWNKLKKRLGI